MTFIPSARPFLHVTKPNYESTVSSPHWFCPHSKQRTYVRTRIMGSHLGVLPTCLLGLHYSFARSVFLEEKQGKINLPPRLLVKMKEKMWKSHSVATGVFLLFLASCLITVSRDQTLAGLDAQQTTLTSLVMNADLKKQNKKPIMSSDRLEGSNSWDHPGLAQDPSYANFIKTEVWALQLHYLDHCLSWLNKKHLFMALEF